MRSPTEILLIAMLMFMATAVIAVLIPGRVVRFLVMGGCWLVF